MALLLIFCVRECQQHAVFSRLGTHYTRAQSQQTNRNLPQPATPVLASQKLSPAEAHALIRAAALRNNVPAAFVQSIVAAESNFNPAAVSRKGAVGLMQLMPQTAQQYGANPAVPAQNIDAGTRYLRTLMARYHRSRDWLRRTIAAYNAGPRMVDKYRGVPPFRETRSYVARVLAYMRRYQRES